MGPVPYEYTELEKLRQIRLIDLQPRQGTQLQCGLRTVDLDDAPRFTALSYTHGPPVAREERDYERYDGLDLVPLSCDGRELLIKPNLASALNQLDILGQYGYYWIDAACINQQDLLERQSQVEMMGDIYWTAGKVLIWLGEEDRDSKIVTVFIEDMLPIFEHFIEREGRDSFACTFRASYLYDRLGIGHISADIWDGVGDFFERRWFCRAWTFQEALLAQKIEVFCGTTKFSWKRLRDLLKILGLANWQISMSRSIDPPTSLDRLRTIPGSNFLSTVELRNQFFNRDPKSQLHLANIAGGSENMDLLLGYIEALVRQMRFRSALDPRDHFFALYGVVSRICYCALPQLSNPLISPDYTKTVAEVYVGNIKSLLTHSRSLLLLSHVEDRSHRRRTDLPSWVPDMTVVTATLLFDQGNGAISNASKGALPQLASAPNLETLSLVGYRIDHVADVGDDYTGAKPYENPFQKSIPILLRMSETYITGQDRVEVFWRTLIADMTENGTYPAPEALAKSFRSILSGLFSLFLVGAQYVGDAEYSAAMEHTKPFIALAKSNAEAASYLPSLEEIQQQQALHAEIHEIRRKEFTSETGTLGEEDSEALEEKMQQMYQDESVALPYGHQLNRIMLGRRVFLTADGLLGLGPQSVDAGDDVFVLPGARVPFLLRPIDRAGGCGSGEVYEMVGECYVHGIMQGEALERGDPRRIDLDII